MKTLLNSAIILTLSKKNLWVAGYLFAFNVFIHIINDGYVIQAWQFYSNKDVINFGAHY
jgi:hypothetical protein